MTAKDLGALPEPVQSVFDTYLDAVDRVLYQAGVSRAERREICDDLESHARELLAERITALPTSSDAIAVVARMAPPEQFIDDPSPPVPVAPAAPARPAPPKLVSRPPVVRDSRAAMSAATALFTVLATAAVTVVCVLNHTAGGEEFLVAMLVLVLTGGITAGTLAWQYLRDHLPAGRLEFLGLAVFGLALVPVFLASSAAIVLVEPFIENVLGIRGTANRLSGAMFPALLSLSTLLVIVATGVLACVVQSAVRGPARLAAGVPPRSHPTLVSVLKPLCILQMTGIIVAAVLVFVQTETIVFTGPALSLLGIAIAAGCLWARSRAGVVFGLSAPCVSLICLAVIIIYRLGPNDATLPIGLIAILYALVAVPLGLATLRQLGGISGLSVQIAWNCRLTPAK